jgi:nicotinamidase-related amidase
MVHMNVPLSPRQLLPDPSNTVLLVIDIQERLAAAMPGDVSERVVRNASILVKSAREFSLPVMVSEQYPRGLGATVGEIKALLPEGTTPIEKVAFSCCAVPAFQSLLDRLGQQSVILCGIETHVCVLQTALDLLQSGRRVYVAADAAGSRTKQNWRIGLDLMRRGGAVIGSTETFAFALLGSAGSEAFKRISQMVK